MTEPVIVISPQAAWPIDFAYEAARIRLALEAMDHELHHIGSTAIKGIYAKPVIDMLLLVASLDELDAQAHRLESAGYEAKGEYGIPQRRYFRLHSPQGVKTHHLHSYVHGSEGAMRHLAFRDYMNAHPKVAQAYSTLKRELAAKYTHDSGFYIAGKDAFVKEHELLAMAWYSAAPGA